MSWCESRPSPLRQKGLSHLSNPKFDFQRSYWICVICGEEQLQGTELCSCGNPLSDRLIEKQKFRKRKAITKETYAFSSTLQQNRCVLAFADGTLAMLNQNLQEEKYLVASTSVKRIYCVCSVLGTSYVVTFSENGMISIWDVESCELVRFLDTSQRKMVLTGVVVYPDEHFGENRKFQERTERKEKESDPFESGNVSSEEVTEPLSPSSPSPQHSPPSSPPPLSPTLSPLVSRSNRRSHSFHNPTPASSPLAISQTVFSNDDSNPSGNRGNKRPRNSSQSQSPSRLNSRSPGSRPFRFVKTYSVPHTAPSDTSSPVVSIQTPNPNTNPPIHPSSTPPPNRTPPSFPSSARKSLASSSPLTRAGSTVAGDIIKTSPPVFHRSSTTVSSNLSVETSLTPSSSSPPPSSPSSSASFSSSSLYSLSSSTPSTNITTGRAQSKSRDIRSSRSKATLNSKKPVTRADPSLFRRKPSVIDVKNVKNREKEEENLKSGVLEKCKFWSGDNEGNILVWSIIWGVPLARMNIQMPALCTLFVQKYRDVWIGGVGKIFIADSEEECIKAAWHVKDCFEKNINGLLYLPSVDEVWSCGDADVLTVWKASRVGKRKVATLKGHHPESKLFSMSASSDYNYVFSGGTDPEVLMWHAKSKKILQKISTGHTHHIRQLFVFPLKSPETPKKKKSRLVFVTGSKDNSLQTYDAKFPSATNQSSSESGQKGQRMGQGQKVSSGSQIESETGESEEQMPKIEKEQGSESEKEKKTDNDSEEELKDSPLGDGERENTKGEEEERLSFSPPQSIAFAKDSPSRLHQDLDGDAVSSALMQVTAAVSLVAKELEDETESEQIEEEIVNDLKHCVKSRRIRKGNWNYEVRQVESKPSQKPQPSELEHTLVNCGGGWELLQDVEQNRLHSLFENYPLFVSLRTVEEEIYWYECPALLTVDYIKSEIFRLTPSLQKERHENYYLAIQRPGSNFREILKIEFKRFIFSNDTIQNLLSQEEIIPLSLVLKRNAHLQGTKDGQKDTKTAYGGKTMLAKLDQKADNKRVLNSALQRDIKEKYRVRQGVVVGLGGLARNQNINCKERENEVIEEEIEEVMGKTQENEVPSEISEDPHSQEPLVEETDEKEVPLPEVLLIKEEASEEKPQNEKHFRRDSQKIGFSKSPPPGPFPGLLQTDVEGPSLVCLNKGGTDVVVRIPFVGDDGTLGDLRESAIRDLELLLQALKAGGNFAASDADSVKKGTLLTDHDSLKKLNSLGEKQEILSLSVLPPNETVELYEKLYPLRETRSKSTLLGAQRNVSEPFIERPFTPQQPNDMDELWKKKLKHYFHHAYSNAFRDSHSGIFSKSHRDTLSLYCYDRLCMRRKMINTIFAAEIAGSKQSDFFPSHFFARFHIESINLVKTVSCHGDESMSDAVNRIIALLNRGQNSGFQDFDAGDYIVKLSGLNEYVLHDAKLYSITRLRQSMEQAEEIKMVLIEAQSESLYGLRDALSKERINVHSNMTSSLCQHYLKSATESEGSFLSLTAIQNPVSFSLRGLQISDSSYEKSALATRDFASFHVVAMLYYGSLSISPAKASNAVSSSSLIWENETITFDIALSSIPLETRINLVLYGDDRTIIGWVNLGLFTEERKLITGNFTLGLWPGSDPNPSGIVSSDRRRLISLFVDFPEYPLPLEHSFTPEFIHGAPTLSRRNFPSTAIQKDLEKLVTETDPLSELTVVQKELIWEYREAFMGNPRALAVVLQAVDWISPDTNEVGTILRHWAKPSPEEALGLLHFVDFRVQEYALNLLEELSDTALLVYLFFLVHGVKMSCFNDTALTRFLITRALQRPHHVGHYFFWTIVSEMHDIKSAQRYGLLMDAFLRGCGDSQRQSLLDQLSVCSQLDRVAKLVQSAPAARRRQLLQQELLDLDFPSTFQNPVNPKIEVSSIRIEKCKVMDSFTAPIWLHFSNADPTCDDPVRLLFKVGDDLRQDSLVVYALRVIDSIWKKHGLDLRLSLYECLPTGESAGFIEVVPKSEALANIQKTHGGGGFKGAISPAFSKSPLSAWLRSNLMNGMSLSRVVENFMFSCAGYTVASFVLGLGDRHNDNIMIRKSGHLFHIDFAHFLGNIMKWRGFKRETAPFVLTNEFVHVMGGEKSELFKSYRSLCCTAYNILRKHTRLLVSLFLMMLHAGLPQLRRVEDIEHLKTALAVDMTDVQADVYFRKLIDQSLKSKITKVNFALHNVAKMGKPN